MTHSSNSGNQPPRLSHRLRLILLSRPVIGTFIALLAIGVAASWRLWVFVNRELAPMVEQNLGKTLNRPVQLGAVERFSLTGLRFGGAAIPAFTKEQGKSTFRDADSANTKAVEVSFNPLDLLFTRTLNLDVTLVEPQLYLDQTKDGAWISTPITPQPEEAAAIKTVLKVIRFRQAEATLAPFGSTSRQLRDWNGEVFLSEEGQRLQFNGSGQVSSGGKLELQGQWMQPTQALTLKAKAFDLALQPLVGLVPQLPAQPKAGQADADLQVQYRPNQPLQVEGTARLKAVVVVVPDQYVLQSSRPRPRTFQNVNGTIQFSGKPDQQINFNLTGQLAAIGNLRLNSSPFAAATPALISPKTPFPAAGSFRLRGQASPLTQQTTVRIQAENLAASVLDGAFQTPIQVGAGLVGADLTVQLNPKQPLPQIKGTARLKNVTAKLTELPQVFRSTNGQLRFQGTTITVEQMQALYGQVPVQARGSLDLKTGYNLTADTAAIPIATALDTLQVQIPLTVAGQVQVQGLQITGGIETPVVTGFVTTTDPAQIDRVPFQAIASRFRVSGSTVQVTDIQAVPAAGGVITGQADYDLRPGGQLTATLQTDNAPGTAIARLYGTDPSLAVGTVSARAQVSGLPENLQTLVQFRAPQATYPTTGEILVRGNTTSLRNIVSQVAGGRVTTNGAIVDQTWRATARASGIALRQFSKDLQGRLSGQMNFAGTLADLAPTAIRAQGQVRFSQGLAVIQQPLTAQVGWNGQQIIVQQATAPGFSANGIMSASFQGTPQITALDLNITARNYRLNTLSAAGPTNVKLAGTADLTGRLTGTPTAPNLNAALRVQQLALQQLAFEPTLSGKLRYSSQQGLDLRLAGRRDRITVNVAPNQRPRSFYVKRDQAIAQGRTQGEQLLVDVQQFPLAALNLRPVADQGVVSGIASGNFAYNFSTENLAGTVAIARPALGTMRADQFKGNIRLDKGIATLTGGDLRRGNSQVLISARATTGANPQFSGQMQVAHAQVQDVLQTLGIRDLGDLQPQPQPRVFGKAADVQPFPRVGIPDAPLLDQLRYFSGVSAEVAQQQAQAEPAPTLLPLRELQGSFQGQIAFSGSQKAGLKATFDIQGQDFKWGEYSVNQAIATGSLADGVVNLEPLRIASKDSVAVFTGRIGGKQQSGQLTLSNVPVDPLNRFVALPFKVAGNLSGTATLIGSVDNPQAQGQFSVANGMLNDKKLQQAKADFAYENARLNFQSSALLDSPEPIRITGNLPYKLPFAKRAPDSEQISLDINIKNQALSLLNLLTDQVAWVEGQGAVDLQVRGTLKQPLIEGTVALKESTFKAQALAEPLTAVTGTIRFDRDRFNVEQLTGQFAQAKAIAVGALPLSEAKPQPNPLSISVEQSTLKLKDLYVGNVSGKVVVTGTALSPAIGGAVELSNGQVLLTQTARSASPTPTAAQPPTQVQKAQKAQVVASASNQIPVSVQVQAGGLNAFQSITPPVLSLSQFREQKRVESQGKQGLLHVDGSPTTTNKALDKPVPTETFLPLSPESPPPQSPTPEPSVVQPPRFNNLQVRLKNNVRVTRPPVLSLVSSGDLTLNGPIDKIQPSGTITFERGGINLFLTRFRLDRRRSNFARFSPADGLENPFLSVTLLARVAEVTSARTTELNEFAEISPSSLGALDTVRVQARVNGKISDLERNFTEVVQLTSTPNRTEGELVSMIGGGFTAPLRQGDPGLAVTTLASSVFINQLQGFIDDALDSRADFRIYPALIPNDRGASVLSLAGELGYNFTNRFSVSVLQVFTGQDTPTRFNLNYQVSDRWQLRTGISVTGEAVGIVEYRARF